MDAYKRYLKHLSEIEEDKRLRPEKYHHKCMDCGQFVKRERWQSKDDNQGKKPLCSDCWDNYDDPMDY